MSRGTPVSSRKPLGVSPRMLTSPGVYAGGRFLERQFKENVTVGLNPGKKGNTRQVVVDALRAASTPLDAYQVAQASGVTPSQAAHTLSKLATAGLAMTSDPPECVNDLAARFQLTAEPNAARQDSAVVERGPHQTRPPRNA